MRFALGLALVSIIASAQVQIQPIRRNVFLFAGDGANITVQVEPAAAEESHDSVFGGDTGVLIVDTGMPQMTEQLLAAIRGLSKGPIRYAVNTSAGADHTGGNQALVKASGGIQRGALGGRPAGPPLMILAHEKVLEHLGAANMPVDAWPTDAFASTKEVFFNGGSTQIIHIPGAHSDGDSIVYLRRSDVIAAGELFSTTGFPRFDAKQGGHIQGILDGLNRILDLAIPGEKEQGGTMIVPAHGRLSDEADVAYYREMVQIIRDRVAAGIQNGKTLDEVHSAHPALEYEKRYSQPDWTADQFVAAIYNDLARKPVKKP